MEKIDLGATGCANQIRLLATKALPLVLLGALVSAGCGEPVSEVRLPGEDLELQQGAIQGGSVVNNDYSGVIALQVWSVTLNGYYTFCTATMMSPTVALTAKHCLTTDLGGRPIFAKMGSQRKATTSMALHPNQDVAVIRFEAMSMWNWVYDHYQTPWPNRDTVSFRRGIYTGTNASLDGKTMACWGHGPGAIEAPLTAASFPAKWNDGWNPTDELHLWFASGGPKVIGGDSGMGCGVGGWGFGTPIAFINEGIMGNVFAYGYAAESWRNWFGF